MGNLDLKARGESLKKYRTSLKKSQKSQKVTEILLHFFGFKNLNSFSLIDSLLYSVPKKKSTLDSPGSGFFLVFLKNLMDTLKKYYYFSHLKLGTDSFCIALFSDVVVAASLKIPEQRSAIEGGYFASSQNSKIKTKFLVVFINACESRMRNIL